MVNNTASIKRRVNPLILIKRALILSILILRPAAAAPFVFAFILGGLSADANQPLSLLYYTAVASVCIVGGLHIINAIADRAVDKTSTVVKDIAMRAQPFATGELSVGIGMILAILLLGEAVWIFTSISTLAGIMVLIMIALGYMYSLPPRVKGRPFFDVASNSVGAGLMFGLGFLSMRPSTVLSWMPLAWIIPLVAGTYILTLLADYAEDVKNHIRTTAVALGEKAAVRVSTILYALALIIYGIIAALRLSLFYIIILPGMLFGIHGYWQLWHEPTAKRAARLMRRAAQAAIISVIVMFLVYLLVFAYNRLLI